MGQAAIDLVIAGVGNQPLAYACFVLARMARNKGLEVRIFEPENAQQYGCKALAHVRISSKVRQAPIEPGQANVLLGLEPIDALKALPYLQEGGVAVVNVPRTITDDSLRSYFPDVEKPLALFEGYHTQFADTFEQARQIGIPIAMVTILLGMLSTHLPFGEFDWKHAIAASVPRRTFGANIRAFDLGRGETEAPTMKASIVDETDLIKKDTECSDTTM